MKRPFQRLATSTTCIIIVIYFSHHRIFRTGWLICIHTRESFDFNSSSSKCSIVGLNISHITIDVGLDYYISSDDELEINTAIWRVPAPDTDICLRLQQILSCITAADMTHDMWLNQERFEKWGLQGGGFHPALKVSDHLWKDWLI